MKVILVNGSPHEKGCTHAALAEAAATLNAEGIETEEFFLGNEPISGCQACYRCAKLGKCCIDDAVNAFLDKAAEANGFLFGTPVHFGGATGAITSFLDRVCYADLCGRGGRFALKPAAAITVARRSGTTATWDQLNKYFGLMQMPIVSSQYWNNVHGGMLGHIEQDEEGLQIMRTLARNMAYLLRCQEAGAKCGVAKPQREKAIHTNFIR